jgi:hypothetical protein
MARLSPPIDVLMRLTTAPWRGDPAVAPQTAQRLAALSREGWRVRRALPRNWTLWRGWLRRHPDAPLIVLPDATGRGLSPLGLAALVEDDLALRDPEPRRSGRREDAPDPWDTPDERAALARRAEAAVAAALARGA